MKPLFLSFLILTILILSLPHLGAAPALPTPVPKPVATPIPSPAPPKPARASGESTKSILVHKPMPPAHWGKVVQYKKEQSFSFAEKDRETLHEFVFQDESGIIRTAIFHEGQNGDGFWEVVVWDQ